LGRATGAKMPTELTELKIVVRQAKFNSANSVHAVSTLRPCGIAGISGWFFISAG
jgi:hypothetical protein